MCSQKVRIIRPIICDGICDSTLNVSIGPCLVGQIWFSLSGLDDAIFASCEKFGICVSRHIQVFKYSSEYKVINQFVVLATLGRGLFYQPGVVFARRLIRL